MRSVCFVLTLLPLAAFPQANPWYQADFPPQESRRRKRTEPLRARFPRSGVQDLTPILDEMRGIKSPL